ncbi:prolyl oligopeptidase family serine peptidase [Silanimonas sp.]|uniref:prolyl oligopeptidase family serine peptidase n=1 Tax=Silanimonas sp. TaxID=1929290 RepID=UPI001BC67B0D|nr:prolyl oligopeptidase family serine peptidase [Silanimonas sp.]MBS3895973.1 prolyl oligopeptidase family serine peptidase [Silanimonas sp.]MBS3923767.1 prolyl oligopeptidase family serine peptidase [Xanthomonadaceae bacterium]
MRPARLRLVLFATTLGWAGSGLAAPTPATAPTTTPATAPVLTLAQAMAHPDWIGPPVEQLWWTADSRHVAYTLKRAGSPVRDVWRQAAAGGPAERLDAAALAEADAANPVFDARRTRMAYLRHGDVFVVHLADGRRQQLTHGPAEETDLRFAADGGGLLWRVGAEWRGWRFAEGHERTIAVLKTEDDPQAPPAPDLLRDAELRLIVTLARQREERAALAAEAARQRAADPSRSVAPIHLGSDVVLAASQLSSDGRHLLVALEPKGFDAGRRGQMPIFITESGYEDSEEVRTRVGRNPPSGQSFRLIDLADGRVTPIDLAALPGITDDPLADLRRRHQQPALEGLRPVRLMEVRFGPDGTPLAMLRSVDNKDRWIVRIDRESAALATVHRLTDPAWINWNFNDFGVLPDGRAWWLSEESGFSHLYVEDGRRARALSSGRWEASLPVLAADASAFFVLCNRAWPGDYEICRVPLAGGEVRELTAIDAVEDFSLSPDGRQLALRWSRRFTPPQAGVVGIDGGELRKLTDTRSAEFRAFPWRDPQLVQVPSRHGAGTIWGKLHAPVSMQPGRSYPVVMFVHGAGYLQNVHQRWPQYFREQMFHQLLADRGYLVLDLDFRASEGYGRDWRTAIYRQMGRPELEDYLDGIEYLVANHQADRARIGIYGGSYGGFIALMAMFKQPGVYQAGAALRPVTDWRHYQHPYTSNILDTPELGPEVYIASSPIEHAEGLQGRLLIAHGMMDDNVFYQDAVRLAQRLIELRKHGWELASYPLERHGYVQPEAWYDQYRRILELMDETLRPEGAAPP